MKKLAVIAGVGLVVSGLVAARLGAQQAPLAPPTKADAALIAEMREVALRSPDDPWIRRKLARLFVRSGLAEEASRWRAEADRIAPPATLSAPAGASAVARSIGSDIIVGDIPSLNRSGRAIVNTINITAFSLGTWACNIGDAYADWYQGTNQHPVIAQNMYRLLDGRFEQIGMAWLKHGFLVEGDSLCSTCTDTAAFEQLPPGCSDLYSAQTNAFLNRLGPRSEVNAATGVNTWPTGFTPQGNSSIKGRLQVKEADLDPDLNPGARYFVEGQYIIANDAAAGTATNNASFREINVIGNSLTGIYTIDFTMGGVTQVMRPAIAAWQDADPQVTLVSTDIPGDGRMTLGYRVTNNGDGTWRYEYALHNMTSDRCARSFQVPVPDGVAITNIGFHDVDYHSGDGIAGINFDGTDWPGSVGIDSVTWATADYTTNPNANALRFATLYNFRFDANRAPAAAMVAVGLFKPGSPASISIAAAAPSATPPCPADITGDSAVTSADLGLLLGAWGTADPVSDITHDGIVNSADLGQLLGAWGPCP